MDRNLSSKNEKIKSIDSKNSLQILRTYKEYKRHLHLVLQGTRQASDVCGFWFLFIANYNSETKVFPKAVKTFIELMIVIDIPPQYGSTEFRG